MWFCPGWLILNRSLQLQQSSAPTWKVHLDAMMEMISNSGGMAKICRVYRGMCVTMVLYAMCVPPPLQPSTTPLLPTPYFYTHPRPASAPYHHI